MNTILEQITEWLKGMLIDGIMNNLSGMFDAVNQQVGDVAAQVGRSPSAFSPGVFSMVRNVSESVIIPIAGLFAGGLLHGTERVRVRHHPDCRHDPDIYRLL